VNVHTATIRSLGITGVLLVLALVLLAIVSAIFAFDRWPTSGGASTVERVAVDRPDARRVDTVLVRTERSASLVRGAFITRSSGAFATASGTGDVLLVGVREPADQSAGGGFGPPPPTVPFAPPGEGGGNSRFSGTGGGVAVDPPETPGQPSIIRETTCGARDALGQAGAPLDPACEQPATPGQRSALGGAVGETVTIADGLVKSVTVP
jgi:hypothetical protein